MCVHPYLFFHKNENSARVLFALTFISQDFLAHSRVAILAWKGKKQRQRQSFVCDSLFNLGNIPMDQKWGKKEMKLWRRKVNRKMSPKAVLHCEKWYSMHLGPSREIYIRILTTAHKKNKKGKYLPSALTSHWVRLSYLGIQCLKLSMSICIDK